MQMIVARHLPRFRQAYRELGVLAERESWSRTDIEEFQLTKLNDLWAHAKRHVPHYRELSARLALPARFDSLEHFQVSVPILSKEELRSGSRFLSEEATPGKWHRTGGSTGSPLDTYWGRVAHRETLRARYRAYQQWDIDIFDRIAFIWGHSASLAPGIAGYIAKYRQPVEDWLRNRLRLSAYQLGPDDIRRYL